jgi:hypothetical protein
MASNTSRIIFKMKYYTNVHWFKNLCNTSLCLCFLMQLAEDGHDGSKHAADIHCVLYSSYNYVRWLVLISYLTRLSVPILCF